jgi:hypothetical protein
MTDGSQPTADDMLPPPDPGLGGRLIGAVLGRLITGPRPEELMKAIRAPRVPPRIDQEPDARRVYVLEPGQGPAPAEVITDPDLAERLPRLLDQEWAGVPPQIQRHLRPGRTFRLHAILEEERGEVVVRAFNERIGRLTPAGAEEYAAHLRSARLNGQLALAVVRGSIAGRRPVHVTANFMHVFTDDGAQADLSPSCACREIPAGHMGRLPRGDM